MIEAIAALSDSAGRMSIEPIATRKGLDEMAALLIAAHGLVAQLSAARLDARSGAPAADEATRAWLQARLAQAADAQRRAARPARCRPPRSPSSTRPSAIRRAARVEVGRAEA